MELFEKDSVYDLVLRGFSQEAILSMTGVDVGYHGRSVRDKLSGIDRCAYKVKYVRANVGKDDLLVVLEDYATGMSKGDILARFGIPGENLIKLKYLFEALDLKSEFQDADRRYRKFVMSTGFEAIHGTDNPFKLDEFQQQAARTREEKYGAAYTLQKGSSLEPFAREKSIAASKTEATKARRRKTNMEKYGVEHAIQAPDVKAKSRQTMLSRYGVEYYTQTEDAREKQRQRMLKHGKEVLAKAQQTSMKKYGVPFWNQSEEGRARMRAYAQIDADARIIRLQDSMMLKYGVPFNMQRPEMRKFLSEYMREHSVEFREKARLTSMLRYGYPYYMQTDEARMLLAEDMRIRMSDLEVRRQYFEKACESKLRNGTFGTSLPEDNLYEMLVNEFGVSDVKRQYVDVRYPFHCDFYVESRDLFIELNAHWTHGGHWYGTGLDDENILAFWKSKNSDFYDSGVKTWSVTDVKKRMVAEINRLNYVVFWTCDLSDARMWFLNGCLDCCDWMC